MTQRHATLLPVLLLVFLPSCLVCGDPAVWVEDRSSLSLEAGGVGRLACETHNGAIAARGAAAGAAAVDVEVTRRAGGDTVEDAQACLEAIEIQSERDGDQLRLAWRWKGTPESQWRAEVSFDIRQPEAIPLAASTHNGAISASGLRGGVELATHNGAIEVADCHGATRATSHNGRISAAVDSRDVRLETHNGRIELQLSGDGPVAGSVRTHNGSVELRLAEGVQTKMSCTSENGRVTVYRALEASVRARHALEAEIGAGGGRLDVETHNGAIVVR